MSGTGSCCSETTPLLCGTREKDGAMGPLPTPVMESASDASVSVGDEDDDNNNNYDGDGDGDGDAATTTTSRHQFPTRSSMVTGAVAEPTTRAASFAEEGLTSECFLGGGGAEGAVPQRDGPAVAAVSGIGSAGRTGHPRQQRRRGGTKRAQTTRVLPSAEGAALAMTSAGGSSAALLLCLVVISLGVVVTTLRLGKVYGVGDRFYQFASMVRRRTVFNFDPTKTDVLTLHSHHGGNDNNDTKPSSSRLVRDHPTVTSRPGFPSYLDYASTASTPLNVTYDSRSFMINGDRAMFLSGSMHPVRATRATWTQSVNEAVRHNLNMVTLYVMWSAHQPFQSSPLNFDYMPTRPPFRSSEWSLAEAIRIAASRGLFVHVRVGPYVCAEYSYGGIPEWLPLLYPQMDMRRPHPQWYLAMEHYVTTLVQYLSHHKLWAHQGGPIVLAQIENELQGDSEESSAALQGYADWCGAMAQRVAPHVVWTMCNGLVAPNTIETFNGDWAAPQWLSQHGFSRRIQVDQPAMWTEAEGGFQIWGDDPRHPSDYYWGRTARDVAYQTLKWFARGGAHLNYYMFWGGSNFGRAAAAGIANMYASDAALCPSGQRRQPKFDHLTALHEALAEAAPVLLDAPTALFQNRSAEIWNGTSWGHFERENFTVFRYVVSHDHKSHHHEAVFVENNSDRDRRVRVKELRNRIVATKARSTLLFLNGTLRFDSGQLASSTVSYKRKIDRNPVPLTNWSWRIEEGYENYLSFHPLEQTALMVQASRSSDYAWYSTGFDTLPELASVGDRNADSLNVSGRLTIQTQQANGIVAYLDGIPLGNADTHQHKEGNVTLHISIPHRLAHTILTRPRQLHNVDILSESFGHGNLIGCFGVNNTRAKTKGITGNVDLVLEWHDSGPDAPIHRSTVRLTDGTFVWGSMAGLNRGPAVVNSLFPDGSERGSASALPRAQWRHRRLKKELLESHPPRSATDDDGNSYRIGGMWSSVTFPTPSYKPDRQGLFVEVVWGRGHFWLNGVDMGRYWNLTSSSAAGSRALPFYTQRYYFLPRDLLVDPTRSAPNVLEFFDALGWPDADYFDGRHRPRLVLSWIEPSHYTSHAFDDAVGYQDACLY